MRAFRKVVPIKAFIGNTMITNRGAAGVCLRFYGIDDECLTDESREHISMRVMAGHKLFDECDRFYQYAIRRSNCPVQQKAAYDNPKVQEINDDRRKHLNEHAHFGSLALYAVALREGNYKGKKSTAAMVEERRKTASVIASKAESFASELEDLFECSVLPKEDAFLFLRQLLNLDSSVADSLRLKRDTGVDYQLVGSPLVWDESKYHLRMGKRHVRVLSLKEASLKHDCGLPTTTVPNLLKDVFAIDDCDMIVCQQFHRTENPEVREEIRSHKKHVKDFERHGLLAPEESDAKTDELMADQSADATLLKLGSVLEDIENKGGYYGKFSYTIVLHGEDDSKLDAAIAKINKVFGTYDGAMFEEDRGALFAYFSILPGNARYAVREQWLGNQHLADLSLIYCPYQGSLTTSELDGHEYLGVYETRDRTPFYWDPFVDGAFGLFGVGRRGRGKTMAGNFIVASAQKFDGYTCILDIGGSYTYNVKHFGGTIVSLRLGTRSFSINPFLLEDNEDNHQFLFKFFQLLIERDGKELDSAQEKELFDQIVSMYHYESKDRTLSNFYESAPRFYKDQLLKWTRGGQFGWVFDNVEDNVALSRMTCFEFEGVEDYQELMEPLVMWLLGRMRAKFFDPSLAGVFKLVNADEVWKYLQNPRIVQWLSEMLKTGRKHLVACAFWTQSAEDLGEAMRLILDNCESTFFLGNPNFDRTLFAKSFGFNERELEIAAHLKSREILLKTEAYSKVLKFNVDPKMYWRFTTRPKDRVKRQQAIEKYGDDEAIKVLAAAAGK
jgi:type IV secretion system protein VirB4